MTDRKKPSAGFWITVALVAVLLGYPLSIGPACWITSWTNIGARFVPFIYWPMTVAMSQSEDVARAINWYARLGSGSDWNWIETGRSEWGWMELR